MERGSSARPKSIRPVEKKPEFADEAAGGDHDAADDRRRSGKSWLRENIVTNGGSRQPRHDGQIGQQGIG